MRTKGSLNKKTIEKMKASKPNKSGVYTINLEKQIENNPIVKDKARKWVTIGVRNTYYYDLLNLFNTSVTFKACVNFAKRAIVGQGLDLEQMKLKDEDLANPNYFTDWNTFIDNFTLDYILYGSAAFQIIMNKDKRTYSFFNVPFDTLRSIHIGCVRTGHNILYIHLLRCPHSDSKRMRKYPMESLIYL